MSRTYSRRAAVAALGAGLAALTGATARQSRCETVTGSTDAGCAEDVVVSGPSELAVDESGARFVAANESPDRVTVSTGAWRVFRREAGDWTRVAAGPGEGSVGLDAGDETAWVLLTGADGGGVVTAMSSRTRYVGPVALSPGQHAFAVAGRRGGEQFESVTRFRVTE